MMSIPLLSWSPEKTTCKFFEDLRRPWWKYKSLNDTFHLVTLSQCLAKIHFNLSNIFQNILRVQYIALLGLIDTYLAKQTFISEGKVE